MYVTLRDFELICFTVNDDFLKNEMCVVVLRLIRSNFMNYFN